MFGDETSHDCSCCGTWTKDDLNCVSGFQIFQIFQMSSQTKNGRLMKIDTIDESSGKAKTTKTGTFSMHNPHMHLFRMHPTLPPGSTRGQAFRLTGGISALQSSGSDLLGGCATARRSRHFLRADTINYWLVVDR